MRSKVFILSTFVALCSFVGVAEADMGPSCKCDIAASSSSTGVAAACSLLGVSVLVFGRRRSGKS